MSETELDTGTFKELSKDAFKEVFNEAIHEQLGHLEEIGKLKAEVKKSFWAGFEISHSLGGTNIQARWNEYEKLRGLGE